MIVFENIRISVYSETLFRIEYQPDHIFSNMPTLLMGTQIPSEISYVTQKEGNILKVSTKKCELQYQKLGDRFDQDFLEVKFHYKDTIRLWTPKTPHTMPPVEIWRSLDEWSRVIPRCPTNILPNRDGWHQIVDNAGAYWSEEKQWPIIQRPPYYENWYLFFYGDDLTTGFYDFIHLLGCPPLLPRKAFGAWYSRWYPFHQRELLELLQEYKNHDIPLDVLVVDVNWHQDHWNGYDWRPDLFPEPNVFIQKVKDSGLKLVLNDHPGYENNDPLPAHDSHLPKIQQELKEPPYKGMWACDWTRQSSVNAWKKYCLQDILAQGIDWWWIDGWTDYAFLGVDSQMWVNWQYYSATQEMQPDMRVLILSRWGGLGSHRYPIQFSGDTHSTFASLAREIEFTAFSGGVGANYWSHDIGGFHEGKINEEVYIRWVQFGVFSPIFRTHSNHGIREPFHFSDKALQIYGRYMKARYVLLPYWEQLHHQYHNTGFPSFAAMSFVWPQLDLAYQYKQQYMIGKDILVSPISTPIQNNSQTAMKETWLPKGRWLGSDGWQDGDLQFSKGYPIDTIPVFIKSGAIIPTIPLMSPIRSGAYSELCIHMFGDIWSVSKQKIVLDDGERSKGYMPTELEISASRQDNTITLHVDISASHDFLPDTLRFIYHPDGYRAKTSYPTIPNTTWNETIPCLSQISSQNSVAWEMIKAHLEKENSFQVELIP